MHPIDRRRMLTVSASLPLAASASFGEEKAQLKGNLKQSIVFWCFNVAGEKWDVNKTCEVAKSLGCASVEIVGPDDWPTLKKHGLTCALAPNGMPGAPFMKGVNNPKYHDQVIASTKKMIESCAEAKFPAVIAFTGYKYVDADNPKSAVISRDDGEKSCVKALKRLAVYAEKHKVNVCLEHLNTRDDTHPMKGHSGYQGDDVDWVAGIVRQVGSERVKLLFDVYHVQVMHGDVIRRLEQCKDVIGHVHTAGNPGRGELDDEQEINYPAVMKKLVKMKYAGYVGQEFIPTRKPLEGLRQAVRLCDV
jgi:sugar phosphate isomerase/epimerase